MYNYQIDTETSASFIACAGPWGASRTKSSCFHLDPGRSRSKIQFGAPSQSLPTTTRFFLDISCLLTTHAATPLRCRCDRCSSGRVVPSHLLPHISKRLADLRSLLRRPSVLLAVAQGPTDTRLDSPVPRSCTLTSPSRTLTASDCRRPATRHCTPCRVAAGIPRPLHHLVDTLHAWILDAVNPPDSAPVHWTS